MTLQFQPQIDTVSETLIGAETLIRWNHPTRGVVGPAEFIRVAEETGLMVPIGEWVLRTACEAAVTWTHLPDLRVAVNVSTRQLEHPDFAERVHSILAETGFPASRLELELTESVAANDASLAVLTGLREFGARIAIDDFGTGYSSLTLLKKLPVDLLKIDHSFIRDAVQDSSYTAILDAIVGMARGLGLDVLAEGVETVEEMDLLASLGCHQMQGYLFSKPIPKLSFEQDVMAEDARWRLPVERPEAWQPPSVEELRREAVAQPAPIELLPADTVGDDCLPALKE